MAEINTFTTAMSDKHRRCYQIMKYLSDFKSVNNYNLPYEGDSYKNVSGSSAGLRS